ALAMPASVIVQFCLITTLSISLTTVVSWSLLLIAMAVPYIVSGVVVSMALTRSPFSAGLVYGVDLLGAALGCIAVVGLLDVFDGPTTVVVAGITSGISSLAFAASASVQDSRYFKLRPWWRRPTPMLTALVALLVLNSLAPVGIRPILV